MEFGEDCKVIIGTLDEVEAKAFIKFLESEIIRHQWDIDNAKELIREVKGKWTSDTSLDGWGFRSDSLSLSHSLSKSSKPSK